MEQVVAIPIYVMICASLVLGTLTQLHDLAEQTSDRTVKYAEDMVSALDCAMEARPLTECSPDLFNKDVRAEIEETQAMLMHVQEQAGGPAIA